MTKKRDEMLARVKRSRAEVEASQDAVLLARDTYVEAVRELHSQGMSLREIAAELDLSHQRVHQMIYEDLPSKKTRSRTKRNTGIAVLVAIAVTSAVLVSSPWSETPQRASQTPSRSVALADSLSTGQDMSISAQVTRVTVRMWSVSPGWDRTCRTSDISVSRPEARDVVVKVTPGSEDLDGLGSPIAREDLECRMTLLAANQAARELLARSRMSWANEG